MTDQQRTEIRKFLESKLDELMTNAIERCSGIEACADENEYASRVTEQSLSVAISEREASLANEIKDALRRMDSFEFGMCEECGEDIGVARLKAQPTATLCIACQQAMEEMPYAV